MAHLATSPALAASILLAVLPALSDMDSRTLSPDDLATIERQYAAVAFATRPGPAEPRLTAQAVAKLVETIAPDGSWTDIDYRSPIRSRWPTGVHIERITTFARATRDALDPRAPDAFHSSLAFWLRERPQSQNWWWNQIGAPLAIARACLVLDGTTLSDDERTAVVDYLAVCGPPDRFTGQNRVWIADGNLCRALLARDPDAVRQYRDIIASEAVFAPPGKEGLQRDGSFHQHGVQNQFGNYGLSFLNEQARFAAIFANTPCAYGDAELDALKFLADEGYGWVLWRGYLETGSLGRQLVRNAARTKATSCVTAMDFLALCGRPDLVRLRDHIRHSATPNTVPVMHFHTRVGNNVEDGAYKYFPSSAFSVYRTPTWMASVRMHTPAIVGTEIVNEDNLLGGHMADGALYLSFRGDDYENVFPLWRWRHIPGITSYDDRPPSTAKWNARNRSSYVFGASAGNFGLTAMTCDREGLVSHKAWAFAPDCILALGVGISSDEPDEVVTTIEQCNRSGPVAWFDSHTGVWHPVEGVATIPADIIPLRILHGTTGYIVFERGLGCEIRAEHRTGDFRNHMGSQPSTPAEGDVFELVIHHGASPKNAQYEYWIVPDSTPDSLLSFDPHLHFLVEENTPACQRIRYMPSDAVLEARRPE